MQQIIEISYRQKASFFMAISEVNDLHTSNHLSSKNQMLNY